ncbi:MAG TPA: hypothetical protein VHD33_04835, partial [Legionellaceae bacterium]|nr:hypothetical protein [Legionellaceae bacterium]
RIIQKTNHANWQDNVLAIYDPSIETQLLKHAADKVATFLQLRKAHHFRHDFHCYQFSSPSPLLKKALNEYEK